MTAKWTDEQQQAINERGKDILVSAAAGSGKTAVLVERIVNRILDKEHPVDIDRLLIVTFTKAAAAEMRERIRNSLYEHAQLDPGNEQLQRQLVLVNNAKISTMDSFCQQVLRNHFQEAKVDPSFRVVQDDGGEEKLLEQDTVKEVVDEAYEKMSENFAEFLEQFTTGREDEEVEADILDLYHFAQGQPFPEDWLDDCAAMYSDEAFRFLTDENLPSPAWIKSAESDTAVRLKKIERQLNKALEISGKTDGPKSYETSLRGALEMLGHFMEGSSYAFYAKNIWPVTDLGKIGTVSKKQEASVSKEKKDQVCAIWKKCGKDFKSLRDDYYYEDPADLKEELLKSGVALRELIRLTKDFMGRLNKKKAERKVLDFDDMEHLTLQTLMKRDPEDPKSFIQSEVALEYARTFEEVITDEYQDISLVQERILALVSGKGEKAHNRFMVGDVKQSIYGFRQARPDLFEEKFDQYPKSDNACRIDLNSNFRSRRQVIDSVNGIFGKIMTKPVGKIAYDDDARLYFGAAYPEKEEEADPYETELLITEKKTDGEDSSPDKESTKQEREAAMAGRRIKELVGKLKILDKESQELRPARYGDIVILLRTAKGWAEPFGEVLQGMGIPCHNESREGYFSAAEIRVVLSYLEILDNPLQDIPLAAVLKSPIGKLTDEELSAIRLCGEECQAVSFYDCCRAYMEKPTDAVKTKEKLENFFTAFEQLRAKAEYTPIHQLLWELLDVTGYGAYASALPAGRQRKANLDMLVEKAIDYEKTSYRGLYHFVRYIENIQKYKIDYGEANMDTEPGNCVRIMTIHHSKGLEFPVVFVCGLEKQFNDLDLNSSVLKHPKWGIACSYVEHKGGENPLMRWPTLLKRQIRQELKSENRGEEIRLLYVAMTRAKEKLILSASVDSYEKQIAKWKEIDADIKEEGTTLSYDQILSASSYLDWVVPAYLNCFGEEKIQMLSPVLEQEKKENEKAEDRSLLDSLTHMKPDVCHSESAGDYLKRVIDYSYPYEFALDFPGKLTVTELKKDSQRLEEDDAREIYPAKSADPIIPKFMKTDEESESGGGKISGAERGTAYHTFMENLDYSRKEDLQSQLKELASCGKLSEEEKNSICLSDITVFLGSDIGRRMEKAAHDGTLLREQPFVLGVPAGDVYQKEELSKAGAEEIILVQGIIDAFFTEDEKITIVDYKTDKVSDKEELIGRYKAQLGYYKRALEQIKKLPVVDAIIYSFSLNKEIHLSL